MKMKKQLINRILSFVLTFVMVISMLPLSSLTAFAADGGSCAEPDCTGTYKGGICTSTSTHYEQPNETTDVYDLDGDDNKDVVYEISNEGQFRWFAAKVNAGSVSLNAVLTSDITFTTEWTPIGNLSYKYSGFFDGQNYTVDFAYHNAEYRDESGLFGYSTGIIKNVKVYNFVGNYGNYNYVAAVVGYNEGTISHCVNLGEGNSINFNVGSYGGGIAGMNNGGTIENCTSYIPILVRSYSGGIAGRNISAGTIKNCINYGKISAITQKNGGIVGENYEGTVENCVNYGEFAYGGTSSFVGGIVGSNRYGNIINCLNSAYVYGDKYIGGIAGENDGQITYCQNDGKVNATSSEQYYGGIVGYNAGTISACFNSGEISVYSGSGDVGGIAGYNGISKTIENCANTGYINSLSAGAIVGGNYGNINSCYNLGELTAGAYGVVYYNAGSISNVYYKDGNNFYVNTMTVTVTKMTEKQFTSGEVAYLLNNKVSDGTQVWYQNIDNGQTVDSYPVLDSASGTIYKKCNGTSYIYSNSNEGIAHKFTGECDTICDVCEYTREVSVEHIEGTPATCDRGAICQTCGSIYGEKSGEHDVNEETAVCRGCNHQFALKYETVDSEKPMFTDDANTAIDACFGMRSNGAKDGTVTLFTDVIYNGNIKSQVQVCTSTIVLNGHTLTLSGKGFDFWGTKITIDGTNGGTLNCTNGSPIIWQGNSTVKIIGNPSYKQNGIERDLEYVAFGINTPTLDLTEYTGNGFTFSSQSSRTSFTVNLPDSYFLINAKTGETITSADVVGGVIAKVVYNHIHEWEYTVNGTTITATCVKNDGECTDTNGGYVTISAPNNLTYTGNKIEAIVDDKLTTGATVEVTYTGNTTGGYPVNAGDYIASITLDDETTSVKYTIKKATPTANDFVFTAPTDLTYDDTDKEATVTVKDGIAGMGEIKVMYFRYSSGMWIDNQRAPHYPGKYKVGIWLTEGDNYNAVYSNDRIWLGSEFEIKYLETSAEATVSGTMGSNGWYISEVTLKAPEGYQISKTYYYDGFCDALTISAEQNETVTYYLKDTTSGEVAQKTLSLKIDLNDPIAQYNIKGNGWREFVNFITFGIFCKDNANLTVQASDTMDSSVTVEYKISNTELTAKDITDWTAYTGTVALNQKAKNYIYIRITDDAGRTVIYESGVVVFTDCTETVSIEYYKNTDNSVAAQIAFNGNTVKEVKHGNTLLTNEQYTVTDDGITFAADYLDTFAASDTPYTFTVSYHPMGVEMGAAAEGDTPANTTISLTVKKQSGSVTDISDIGKEYDGLAVSEPTYTSLSTGKATFEYKLKGAEDSTYTTTVPSGTGTYIVRVTVVADDNYEEADATAEFTIDSATLNVSVQQNGKLTYDGGKALTPTVSENAVAVNNQQVSFTYSTEENGTYGTMPSFEKAGTYTVYFKASAPNHNEATGYFTVTVDKAIVDVPTLASKVYNGSPQYADISGTDFYYVRENNHGTKVGEYSVVLILRDSANYKWATTDKETISLTFEITMATNEWETEPTISGWTYGQSANEPTYEAKFGTVKVVYSGKANDGTDYNSETAPTKAGSYTATFTVDGTEDYSGLSDQASFTIAKADSYVTTAPTPVPNLFYNGETQTLVISGSVIGGTMQYSLDGENWSDELPKATNVGTYTVYYKVIGDENHEDIAEQSVTVTIVDNTPPVGMILIKENDWDKFWNNITFGIFCKDYVDVTITADGTGSDVVKVEYLLSSEALDENNMPTENWTELTADDGKYSFSIPPKSKTAVYVRITDEGGNVTFINSNGVVVYEDGEAVDTNANYTYKENSNRDFAVTFNGNTIKSIVCGDTTLVAGTDYIVDYDNGKLVLNADYLNTLSVGNYTFTVSYNPMGVPTDEVSITTEFTVAVGKADPIYTIPTGITATYGDMLADVNLYTNEGNTAGTWSWVDGSLSVGDADTTSKIFYATFTPTDTKNYNVVIGIPVEVTVNKATAPSITFPTVKNEIFYGDRMKDVELSFYSNDYGTFNWTAPTGVPVESGNYALDFYPNDDALRNYDWAALNGVNNMQWIASRNALCIVPWVTVNPAPVTNIGNDAATKYDGNTYDVSQMFTIDGNAGEASYAIVGGTGEGTLNGSVLTITKIGTFEIKLTTGATTNYKAGEATATLTVEKGMPSVTVAIEGWVYGEEPNAPIISAPGEVEIRYENSNGDEGIAIPTDAGVHKVTVTFLGNDLYESDFAIATFTIAQKELTPTVSGNVSKTYDGTTDVPSGLSVTLSGIVMGDDVKITASYAYDSADAGTTKINATNIMLSGDDAKNYTLKSTTASADVGTITAKNIDDVTVELGNALTYTGSEQTQTFTVGELDGLTVTYTVSGEKVTKVGVYELTISGNGNFTGTKTVQYTVAPDTSAIAGLTTGNVTSANEEAIKAVVKQIEDADDTLAAWDTVLTDCNAMLTRISEVKIEINRIVEAADDYALDTVKSSDKETLEQIVNDAQTIIDSGNVTAEEKTALEETKAAVEVLIAVIEEIADATDTENVGKVENVTSENVTLENKTDLENAKADLEKALDDNSGNYTEDEKNAIEDEIKRIEDALEVIENVESVKKLIDKLPENITKNDEDAIKAADDAYNALSDYEKSLVDEESKKALDDAKKALAELNKPATPNSPITGDNSNIWLWFALLFVSGGVSFTLAVVDKKRKAVK